MASGSIPLPALDVRPPQPNDALGSFQKLMALRSMANQQQIQQQQIASQQQEQQLRNQQIQDQQLTQQYLRTNKDATFSDAANALRGQISMPAFANLMDTDAKIRQAHAAANESELKNRQSAHDQYQQIYSNAMNLSDQDLAAQSPQIVQQINSVPGGSFKVDPSQPLTKDALKNFGIPLALNEAYLKQEADKRKEVAETAKNTEQAGASAEAANKSRLESQYYQQHGGAPGVPVETVQMNDWLAKNPGKTPADFLKYKATLVPQFNFNLQSGSGAAQVQLNPQQQATRDAILEGRMSPPGSFALKTPYWQAVMGGVFQSDPQFNEQRAQLRKDFTVGPQSKEINAINTAMGHVGVLGDAIDALNNGDFRRLNQVANILGVETGKDTVTTFKTIVNRVGPEIAKAYVGAGGSAGERGSDAKDFDPNLGPQQLKSNVSITAKLLRSKIAALENQWNQNKSDSMPSFEDRFIMPEAKQQLDKWAPTAGGGGGMIRARDPQGKLHEAPAGTALPTGWKLEQ